MILIGDEIIPCENIVKIDSVEEIQNSEPNSTVLICRFDSHIMKYCQKNDVQYAIIVQNIKEVIYANALEAKYIILNKELAQEAQKVADNYMFDSRILAVIQGSDEIEWVAMNEIDGAIYTAMM